MPWEVKPSKQQQSLILVLKNQQVSSARNFHAACAYPRFKDAPAGLPKIPVAPTFNEQPQCNPCVGIKAVRKDLTTLTFLHIAAILLPSQHQTNSLLLLV